MTAKLESIIEKAWDERANVSTDTKGEVRDSVEEALAMLDSGKARVAEKGADGDWVVNQWLKKAVLLSFRLNANGPIKGGPDGSTWWDKVPSKFDGWSADDFAASGLRAVPSAVARRGSYIASGVVLMPSFVNIGAYVDEGTMVDTWATVGSCAQIGKGVHLSGGAGIGAAAGQGCNLLFRPSQVSSESAQRCFASTGVRRWFSRLGVSQLGRRAGCLATPRTLSSWQYSLISTAIRNLRLYCSRLRTKLATQRPRQRIACTSYQAGEAGPRASAYRGCGAQ